MAQVREQQAGRKTWLQRFFLPLHIKLPLEAMAVLFVCVTGYYLSRTVETELKTPGARPDTFEHSPALQPPAAQRAPEQQTDAAPRKAAPPPADRSRDMLPPPASAPPQPPVPPPALQQAPGGSFAPPPPAFREERVAPAASGKSEAMKAAPAAESSNRALDHATEKKVKSLRSLDSSNEAAAPAAPAAADRAAGAPAGVPVPRVTFRLTPDNPATAAAAVRDAAIRSGGSIVDERGFPARQLKVRIPVARVQEFQSQLERLGRITEQPVLQSGAKVLEVTVQW
jgi:hypothetical protein